MSLNHIFEDAVKSKRVPGIAAVALDTSGKVLYRNGFGTVNINDAHAAKVTPETPVLLWSCTKLVTCVAALQLLEQGKLALDDPVEKYVPAVKDIGILEGFDDDGKPKLRKPQKTMTARHLFTHTAGFTYDFFDEGTLKYRAATGRAPATLLATGAWEEFTTPLAHEPGAQYTYGVNIDWLGFCVEAISGMRLEEYIRVNILEPLGMKNTGSHLRSDQERNYMLCHMKDPSGKLVPNADVKSPTSPDKFGGGHYLVGTADDYAQFLLTILNDGTHPTTGTQILKKETVSEYIFTDHLHEVCSNAGVGLIPTTIPQVSRTGEFLPGITKGWSLALMLNEEDVTYGRKKGSGAWAGLGNNYFWIDREGGKVGVVLSAILPFFDPDVLRCFDALEREVYGHSPANEGVMEGKSYAVNEWVA